MQSKALGTVAIDVGGTHTDGVLLDGEGNVFVEKVSSTPANPGDAFMRVLRGLLASASLKPEDIVEIVHGTTVATNAVIMEKYARVGLITTQGFRDVLQIGNQRRLGLYDPWLPKPESLVPRELCVEVTERVASNGSVVTPLQEESVRAAARSLNGKVDVIAVSLLFSFVHPDHELRVREIILEELPGVPVTLSCEVSPEIREYSRASTTVLNAAVLPETGRYIETLDAELRASGFDCPFLLMSSNGGVVPSRVAERLPVSLLVSGPAGGAVGASKIASAFGIQDVVMLDTGGTSADVAFITGGEPRRRYEGEIAGRPVSVPQIDVVPIGAGGGSIASVDEFGALRVGPESAGASPGPAAYGFGGPATVTDAHIVLGNLDAATFLGGRTELDPNLSHTAISALATDLKLSESATAVAIIRVANGLMSAALRTVTVSRGVDVRDCALVAFGGAGPLHACAIAEDLGVQKVIVPRYPGITSALGLVLSDGRLDVSNTYISGLDQLQLDEVNQAVSRLQSRLDEMLDAWHDLTGKVRIELEVDLRYINQAYELSVPAATTDLSTSSISQMRSDFISLHEQTYGHSWSDRPIEMTTLRLSATLSRTAPIWRSEDPQAPAEVRGERQGWSHNGDPVNYSVMSRASVEHHVRGPAILEQEDSTFVISPGWSVTRILPEGILVEREAH